MRYRIFSVSILIAMICVGCSVSNAKEANIALPTIMCGMCETNITNAVSDMDGLIKVTVDLEKKSSKVVFDADKISYIEYYKKCMHIVKSNGIIVLDNMLWGGSVISPKDDQSKVLKELAEIINNDSRNTNIMLPVRDGLRDGGGPKDRHVYQIFYAAGHPVQRYECPVDGHLDRRSAGGDRQQRHQRASDAGSEWARRYSGIRQYGDRLQQDRHPLGSEPDIFPERGKSRARLGLGAL